MPIFAPPAVAWRRTVAHSRECSTAFEQLANTYGRENAKKYLETVYDKLITTNRGANGISRPMLSMLIDQERTNFLNRQRYVRSLIPQSAGGQLRAELRNNLRDPTTYYTNPLRVGLAGRELAIDQAANWIANGYVAALPSYRAILNTFIPNQQGHHGMTGTPALGRTTEHLDNIWSIAVPNGAPYRMNIAGTAPYPSSIGGHALVEEIIRLTAGTNSWPAFGSAQWESIAMFYLISLVHVQGYSDGNKRLSHLAYAIVLIKNTHTFLAPTAARENQLFRMNG